MIDIDKYLNRSIDIRIFGEVLTVLEPTVKSQKIIAELTKATTAENLQEMNSKITLEILNNNSNERIFTIADADKLTTKAQVAICNEAFSMINSADSDPN